MVEATADPEVHLTAKGRATRARIIAVAAQLMFEHGVVGTSIDDVRKAAGVSGSQMTHYFADKHSLVRAVIAWQADTVIELHRQPVLGRLDSFDSLRLWAELHIERQKANECEGGCSFGSLAGELAESDPDTRADLAAGFDRWEVLFQEGLRAMRDRGDLRPDADPQQLGSALLAAMQGGMLMTQTKRDAAPLVASLEAMLAYIESFATKPVSKRRSRNSAPGKASTRRAPVEGGHQ
ncbi:MAG TPA: TetR family transcriptional regulator C-terminal domain-containing protein [Acidimicrobiales bacterium]|nr:TetR family transcriptional regulator C-terminal domain-containing protein [Acidimicrobiales bacterium]